MKTEKRDRIAGEKMEALRALLTTAAHIVEAMAADPTRERFLHVYDKMPMQDRGVLLDVLEREVNFRLATRDEGAALTGCAARINPNARLYMRVVQPMPKALPAMDHEQMVYSNLRSARIMRLVLTPGLHERWRAALAEAFSMLDDDERADVARVARELLEVAAQPAETAVPSIATTA